MAMAETDDKKVKDLLDTATRADLERWFGLPSFEQLAEQGVTPAPPPEEEDPEFAVIRKRREDAIACVDPALLEAIHLRAEPQPPLIKPRPSIALHVNPEIARFNQAMIDRQHTIAEPREVERPYDLEDALRERTPQALLRDLHRPELDFYKVFARVDMIAEYRVDAAATTAATMASSTKLPPSGPSPSQEIRALMLELRAERKQPWINIEMPLRTVTE